MGSATAPEAGSSGKEVDNRHQASFSAMRDTPAGMEFGGNAGECWAPGKSMPLPMSVQTVPLHRTVEEEQQRRRNLWHGIVLGQVLSVLIALASMSAASLDDRGVNLPSFVNLINYSLVTLAFLGPMVVKRKSLSLPWWRYALYAVVDVEANTITVLAYRYTSITSVTMLDAFSIPSVMVLSRLFLHARYTNKHFAGVLLCVSGLALTVISDLDEPRADTGHPHALRGDLLCILGAALYGASNVMQENFVKNHDRVEFLGMAGIFGVILSGIQTMALEWNTLAAVTWTDPVVLFILGYSLSLFVLYCWTSLFLQAGDAALFNLSLLTADIYAFAFAYFVEHAEFNWIYFFAAAVIFCGLFLYHSQPPTNPADPDGTPECNGLSSSLGASVRGAGARFESGGQSGGRSSFCELRDDAGDGLSLTSTSHGSDVASERGSDSVPPSPNANFILL